MPKIILAPEDREEILALNKLILRIRREMILEALKHKRGASKVKPEDILEEILRRWGRR